MHIEDGLDLVFSVWSLRKRCRKGNVIGIDIYGCARRKAGYFLRGDIDTGQGHHLHIDGVRWLAVGGKRADEKEQAAGCRALERTAKRDVEEGMVGRWSR
jgi:hypothetical protein